MSKVEVSLQFFGDLFAPGGFLAVVRSDRAHLLSVWFNQSDRLITVRLENSSILTDILTGSVSRVFRLVRF